MIVAFIAVCIGTRQHRVKDSKNKTSPPGGSGDGSGDGSCHTCATSHSPTGNPDGMDPSEVLASTDGFHDWEISEDRIKICMRDDQPLLLGVGQWGSVYQGIKDGLQAVAVKTLRRCDDGPRSQFIQEIALMQLISRDPGIVQFYGACVRYDTLWLVVELMEGGDLRRAMTGDRAGELRWYKKGKDIVLDAVRGLHFLHSNNVVHRDIKVSIKLQHCFFWTLNLTCQRPIG